MDPEKSFSRRFRMKTVAIHCFRNYVLNFYQFRIQISIQFILSRSLFGPQYTADQFSVHSGLNHGYKTTRILFSGVILPIHSSYEVYKTLDG